MSGTGIDLSRLAQQWRAAGLSPLDVTLKARHQRGESWIDLITANPHEHGLVFPDEKLEEALNAARPCTRVYRPDARGLAEARQAIADYYLRRGTPAEADRILLTPGTSIAYLYALKLLMETSEEVLIPSPGYPLFDDICAVAGVGLRKYHLNETGDGWTVDVDEIDFQCTVKTRAVIVVSPHNPTGAMMDAEQWSALGTVCRRRGLALIVDEVFCEFPNEEVQKYARPNPDDFPLLLTLNGFSKMLSLPGWKVGWLKVDGDAVLAGACVRAAEHMSDTFLPVPDLQQAMIAPLLRAADPDVMRGLNEVVQTRKKFARDRLGRLGWQTDVSAAGIYLCVRMPKEGTEDAFAVRMLNERGVLVHPGYFYDLPRRWVMTCIAGAEHLEEGIRRIGRCGE